MVFWIVAERHIFNSKGAYKIISYILPVPPKWFRLQTNFKMASQAQSLPGSPQDYTNQIRRPHPSADYQTQLACFLLNHLQENLEPLIGRDTNFFNVPYRIHHTLYSHGISSLSQAATLVGLESLGQLLLSTSISESTSTSVERRTTWLKLLLKAMIHLGTFRLGKLSRAEERSCVLLFVLDGRSLMNILAVVLMICVGTMC
jgi:hypothetical protein